MQDNFRLAVEASPNGMVLANAEGRILLVNDRVTTMFGYERAELLEQPMEMLLPLHSVATSPPATHDAAHRAR
jgi:PAS domain S-box-containing protein